MVSETTFRAEEGRRAESGQHRAASLATLGHELRNPLAAILNAVEVLEQLGSLEGEAAEMCGVIRRQASQMSQILDDRLDVARLGQVSQFSVELPTAATTKSSGNAPAPAQPAVRRRVLLIDDRRDAILPAKKMLEKAGHEVFTAGDGPSGIALASTIIPDVILCDIGLPNGMTGYEVAAAIRSAPAVKDVYLVALSGYGQDEDRQRARAAGFDNHLTKPVSKSSLDAMMASFPRFSD